MKVTVEFELGETWNDYNDVCDELLLEDMDLIHKDDILSAKVISRTPSPSKRVCCICGKTLNEFGNNPWPIPGKVCCDKCNTNYVIPARIHHSSFAFSDLPNYWKRNNPDAVKDYQLDI